MPISKNFKYRILDECYGNNISATKERLRVSCMKQMMYERTVIALSSAFKLMVALTFQCRFLRVVSRGRKLGNADSHEAEECGARLASRQEGRRTEEHGSGNHTTHLEPPAQMISGVLERRKATSPSFLEPLSEN